ncbi:MAG: hypothetical protein MI974_00555 [Chitinophagales bacterium]|nr:hypothetical protein [Chitinophagales bacterium]
MKNIRSIGILTLIKIVSAFLSIVYSIIQVNLFGTSKDIETYFAATAVLMIIFSLSQSGVLAEIFLPKYHQLKEEYGQEVATQAFSVVINRISIFVLFLCIIAFFLAPYIIEVFVPGFDSSVKETTIIIFQCTIFLLLPMVINSFFVTILNAEKIYGRTELIGFSRVLLNIFVLLLLYPSLGVWSLVTSLIAGHILTFFVYISLLKVHDFKLYPTTFSINHFDHQAFFRSVYSTLIYVGSTQFYNVVLNSSISLLPQGYYAVFTYVTNLYAKTRGIFTQPLTVVFFTSFSIEMAKKAKGAVNTIKEYLSFSLFLVSLIVLLIISFGEAILTIIWGSEKFPADMLHIAYQILVFNYIAMLVESFGMIFRKIAISIDRTKLLYQGWSIAQLITAGIVYVLINQMGEGALKFLIFSNTILLNVVSWLIVAQKNWTYAKAVDWNNTALILINFLLILPIGIYLGGYLWELSWVANMKYSLIISVSIFGIVILIAYAFIGLNFKIKELSWVFNKLKLLLKP